MNKKNITKKSVKSAYTVDITACDNLYDTALAFALAKHEANIPLSEENLATICAAAINTYVSLMPTTVETVCVYEVEKPKKKANIFKRFWNWLRGRK